MKRLNTTRIIALGFASVILVGGLILCLPIASSTGESIGLFDAMFTATSAVCVTGLVVVDTGTAFSLFGQIVLLILIQTGGLGFMTIATVLFMLAGKRITLRERLVIQESMNESGLTGMVRLIRWVVWMTFAFEGTGALLLATRFVPEFGWVRGLYYSVFHAVSAFCNAGFDLMGNFGSLIAYQNDPVINFTIMALIIAGGLGFGVWRDVFRSRHTFRESKLHTRVVLWMTGALILMGTVFIAAFEWNNPGTMGGMRAPQKIMAALFQSVTMRTAGFNTVDLAVMQPETKFLSSVWMFIGAAPASTGGGIKVTTAALVALLAFSVARGKNECVLSRRTIPRPLVERAVVVAIFSFVIVIVDILILAIAEQNTAFIDLVFEALSAFGTVGVTSAGTPGLGRSAHCVLMVTMFIGRIGPLTFALAIARRQAGADSKIRYPDDKILVG